jgi:hypothetical protein
MALQNIRRGYTAVQVTVTTTPQEIIDLVNTALAADEHPGVAPGACRELNLQNDPLEASSNNILVGDGDLDATRYGYVITPGGSRVYRSNVNNVQLAGINVRTDAGTKLLNVEIMGA